MQVGFSSVRASASRQAATVAVQMSSGSCSTQPGRGNSCANSRYPRARTPPSSPTTSAVTPVVPASMARTGMGCNLVRPRVGRVRRYFYDTEFIEDGTTIDLVSIGVVDETGREFYAVSTEF